MLEKVIPALKWLRNYKRKDFNSDLSAGLVVAIMLIPQGMAYAMLAGLPPVIGLYASTFPLIIYALFGTSRQLAVGPVAMVSLLVLSGVSPLAQPGSTEYISYVLALAFLIGLIQIVMGLFRLGFLINFLSHSVISGFTSAAAIVIGLSQLKQLLGIKLGSSENVFILLREAISKIGQTNLVTFAIGLGSILLLVFFKKKLPRFPAQLVVVVLGTLITYFLQLENYGVKIVGKVPKGIPTFSLPSFSFEALGTLLTVALTITFVGFMESIAIAKSIATKEKYKIDANQEFIGLGLANLTASVFSGYPVTGGFSRTAVNYQAGARTGLASLITALIIILTLLFFTSLFYYLPQAVLAAIIMVAVYGLIDVEEAKHLFRVKKIDGWTLVLTFILTLTLGIETGILLGAAFSLLVFIWRSAYPHMAELGYSENDQVFLNTKRFPDVKTYPHTLIFRVDASLYFVNMNFLEEQLRKKIAEKPDLKNVIMDFSGVNAMDTVAIDNLDEIIRDFHESGIEFYIAGMKGPLRDLVKKADWNKKFGERINYHSVKEALKEVSV